MSMVFNPTNKLPQQYKKESSLSIIISSWSQQSSGVASSLFVIAAADRNFLWAVGDSGLILHSTNAGAAWSRMYCPSNSNLFGLDVFDNTYCWITGDFGTVLSFSEIASAVAYLPTAKHNFQLAQNYPNPFSETTFIPMPFSDRNISAATPVSFKVFDIMGREVLDLSDEFRSAISSGEPLAISSSILPARGVYFYRAMIGGESGMRVMVRR
jgi:hypothetical protein